MGRAPRALPGKLNLKTEPSLADLLILGILLFFSGLLFFAPFGAFSFFILILYRHPRNLDSLLFLNLFLSVASGPLRWPVDPFSYVLPPMTQTTSYATAHALVNLVEIHNESIALRHEEVSKRSVEKSTTQ